MKILIVEDDLTGRLILQSFLLKLGTIETAVDGEKALFLIEQARRSNVHYELICLDINMDGIDGIEVLKRIRQIEEESNLPPAKILMTSAANSMDVIRSSVESHCDGYLLKPFDKEKLMNHLVKFDIIDEETKESELQA